MILAHLNNHHGGRKSEARLGHLDETKVWRETSSVSVESDLRTVTETSAGGKWIVGEYDDFFVLGAGPMLGVQRWRTYG